MKPRTLDRSPCSRSSRCLRPRSAQIPVGIARRRRADAVRLRRRRPPRSVREPDRHQEADAPARRQGRAAPRTGLRVARARRRHASRASSEAGSTMTGDPRRARTSSPTSARPQDRLLDGVDQEHRHGGRRVRRADGRDRRGRRGMRSGRRCAPQRRSSDEEHTVFGCCRSYSAIAVDAGDTASRRRSGRVRGPAEQVGGAGSQRPRRHERSPARRSTSTTRARTCARCCGSSSDIGGINLVIDPSVPVNAPVDLKLTQVPWDQVLDVVLQDEPADLSGRRPGRARADA